MLSLLRGFALAFVCAVALGAQEVRGTWIARDGLGSRAFIASTLDALVQANFNVVCVNVWSRGYTIWPSDVMQRACGVRQDPGYVGRDPLAELIFEAHKRGIEVEAWLEYGFCAGWSGYFAGSNGRGPLLNAHPDWIAMDRAGNTQVSDGAGGFFTWLAHAHPAAQQFLLDLGNELVERYDLDGLQLDRIRYPSTAFGYDPVTSAAYQAARGVPPPANAEDANWKRWRADGLNAFMRRAFAEVKARRGTVRVTSAPVALNTSYDLYLQDWPAWLRDGSLDLVYPQIYRTDIASYSTTLDANLAQVRSADRPKVVPGVRAISGTPTAQVLAMIAANRARGLLGEVLWYMEGIRDDLPSLVAGPYAVPAPVPLRAAGYRPLPTLREEDHPSTQASVGWTPLTTTSASSGRAVYASAAAEWLEFSYTPTVDGLYTVHAHQPVVGGAATATAHGLEHAAGALLMRVDQRDPARGGWQELGTVWLRAGVPSRLRVQAEGGGTVVADAALWLASRFAGGPMQLYGSASGGAAQPAVLSCSGAPGIGGLLRVQLSRVPAATPVAVALGTSRISVPVAGGVLLVQPFTTFTLGADARGEFTLPLRLPSDAGLRGLTLTVQGIAFDASAAQGLSFSAGAEALLR